MKKTLSVFVSGILAGMCIALGGVVFLSIESKVVGALFFTVGLFTVCTQGFCLYTGKICYVFDNDLRFARNLPFIWLGNLAGAIAVCYGVRATRIASLAERAQALCQTKLDDSLLSVFLLAVVCDIFIYIAVDGYAKNPHETGKYLALLFGVVCFITAGTEHCVANMFYFSAANMWSGRTLLYVLVMTAGNSVGGVLFPLLKRACAALARD